MYDFKEVLGKASTNKMEIFRFVSSTQNLTDLRNLLMTSLGPNGRFKILVTSADQVRVTSTSDRIFSTISTETFTDPFAEAVGHVVRGHLATWGDFGLTTGILLCDLVKTFSDNFDPASMLNVRILLNKSFKEVFEISRIKINVADLDQVLSILSTILNSKPMVKSGRTSKNDKKSLLKKVAAKNSGGIFKDDSGFWKYPVRPRTRCQNRKPDRSGNPRWIFSSVD